MAVALPIQFQWMSASRSDVGLVRDRNEDAILDQPERGLWAVADGMGGHAIGDYASQAVVGALATLPPPDSLEGYVRAARHKLDEVNRLLLDEALRRHVRRIGSTVALLLAWQGHCASLWAGDSRIYLFRDGQLRQVTRDHSQAEELRAQGLADREDDIPQLARNTITRAVGASPTLSLDEVVLEVRDGDVFLLCSDGLSNLLSSAEIAAILARAECRLAVETLVNRALDRGGRDNISAVVARAEDLYNSDKTLLNPNL
jgi:protein phosphatase